ncbi:bifunctional 5,10-methylene-tetrahydrofolate dehydrogenase/5,10-methylene-tetrahydrofolate cyclohydrolase [Clostridium fermenticellae]|uniref:Bifunctional protein FolD n=1 Tax=Clostridium fermenticellae TaxID=2068654 RepID=A0A386H562_9CLOT|nr:tetrahydrofolate dehydrogenase/cyclohydrolase catalytic domain-containing protein [Clostridium fermenticellae]AYD40796.1 bifunctional 5,10-methylene-tetrahydrofolate dehydrogenase/5,10-methylene-tetrahydrofolate cyclohydrolase [Clostridium fermenticellae]
MGAIIKGKPVADSISEGIILEVKELKERNIIPKLVAVRVGENESDLSYERGAFKRCSKVGIEMEVKKFPGSISEEEFIAEIKKLNDDKSVNGILVFRPLPKQLSEDNIKYIISPEKDIDCLSPINVAKLMENDNTGFVPCTPSAVMEILKYYNVDIAGKNVVIIGRSMLVGKPISILLLNENATVTICHSQTRDISMFSSKADIVIVGVGKANMIDESYIKEGAIVIDVGINICSNGKLCGDVNTDRCFNKASMITPVPSGVGSVTTSVLVKHVIKACKLQNNV